MHVAELIAGLLLGLLLLLGYSLWHLIRQRQDGLLKSQVIAATSCSVVVTDATIPRHPIIYANPAFRLLTGYADEDVLGQSLSFLNGPHTDRGVIEKLAMAIQDGRACRVLVRHYRKNGTPFWNEVTLSPVKNRSGQVTEHIWVMSDATQRQQAERALKDSHEPSRMLADLISDGVIVASDATIEYVNPSGLTLLGADRPEQVIGKPLQSFLSAESYLMVRQQLEQRPPVDPIPPTTGRLLRLDGSPLDVRLASSPLLWQGKPACLVAISDLTQYKLIESIADERDAQFRLAVESAPNGMLMIGQDGTLSMVNAQVEQMFGYSREELLGRPLELLIPERLRPANPDQRHLFFSTPASRPMGAGRELYGLRKDGTEFPLEIGFNPVSTSSGTMVLATIVDISARRRAEETIRESQERFDLAVQVAHVGIFEHDHRADHLYWSPTLRAIYGVSMDEAGSLQRYIDLIPRDERDGILQALRIAHNPTGDGQFHLEHRLMRPDGELRYVSIRSHTWFAGEGAARMPVRTVGAVVDMTDHKQAEAYLRQASKIEAIGTLAGGIAHEFNNSLTAVLGFSELALPLIPADSKAYRHIQQVVAAGRKSRELVHQLLTFSQQNDPVRRPLSLHSLVKESLKLLRPTIPSWIELRERIAASTRPISADTTQMHQLILHLVENALHAMSRAGGVLDIQLVDKTFSTDQVSPSGRIAAGCYACLTVRDSGEGMEPEVASRIFDPFFTTKPLGEGRGMGLSVVHEIVTSHGGTVLVDSQPDLGTTVSVYLPALPPRSSSTAAPEEPLPHGHECILFVDDEESLAHFGGEMLESLGYYPVVRMSAAEAWQAFKIAPQQFHLLITDLTMPGMSGDMLARECQRLRPDLPVILCTGSDQTLSAETARAQGVTEYVLKPLLLHDLAHTIRRVLDGQPLQTGSSIEAQAFPAHDTLEEPDAVSTRR